jgi:hypothetical protein
MKIKFSDISTYEELYRKYWKLILTNLLNSTSCILIPNDLTLTNEGSNTGFMILANKIGLTKYLKDICKKNTNYRGHTKEVQDDFVSSSLMSLGNYICERMALHEYLITTDYEGPVDGYSEFSGATYVLSKTGIEVALKLQEHADNDRRHKVTVSFSKKAFWISIVALGAAVFSAWLNYKRLDLYEEDLQKVHTTQTAILSNIKDNKK